MIHFCLNKYAQWLHLLAIMQPSCTCLQLWLLRLEFLSRFSAANALKSCTKPSAKTLSRKNIEIDLGVVDDICINYHTKKHNRATNQQWRCKKDRKNGLLKQIHF